MEKTMFFIWLRNRLQPVLTRLTNTVNGNVNEPDYFYLKYLTKRFSIDLKWGTLNTNGSAVAADVVAQDASVPLKRRDTIRTVTGEVPKLGMKFRKSERELQDLQTLQATNQNGRNDGTILGLLFADPIRGVRGVRERLEYMFLQGLSTGYTETTDDDNEGVSIRIDYGYPTANISGASLAWGVANAKPITDINKAVSLARTQGRTLRYMFMDGIAFNNFKSKDEVKQLYAAGLGYSGANIPTPNIEQVNNALTSDGLPQVILIDRYITVENNGIRSNLKPWADGAVVLTESLDLGDITWSTLVEANNPAEQALYSVADDHTLISVYRSIDPYSETTHAQALVVPVIYNVDGVFVINSNESVAPIVNAGDDDTSAAATHQLVGTAVAQGTREIDSTLWEKVSGPGTQNIVSKTKLTTNVTGLETGVFIFKLTATDTAGDITSDFVTITATV